MARLIGERPIYPGEIEFYEFVMREIPDYVYVMFNMRFRSKIGITRETDAILLVPHIGVFVVEIKDCAGLDYKEGELNMYTERGVQYPYSYHPEQLRELREVVNNHILEKFHISPFVYEIHCFPKVVAKSEVKEHMFQVLGSELVFFKDDLVDSDEFLLRLQKCRVRMNHMLQDRNCYRDLTDAMAYNLYKYWDTGMEHPERPAKPPLVFLSYNQKNQNTAEEIKADLENRGIFVWRAPEDVPVGKYYLPEEMAAIEECDAFLILLSSSSQDSHEVKIEFEKAKSLDKFIIPVLIEEFDMNEFYTQALTQHQFKNLFKPNNETMDEIESGIREAAAR